MANPAFDLIGQSLQGFQGIWVASMTDLMPGAAAPPSVPAAHETTARFILMCSVHAFAPRSRPRMGAANVATLRSHRSATIQQGITVLRRMRAAQRPEGTPIPPSPSLLGVESRGNLHIIQPFSL
jgi:hypothetical protein